MSRGTWELVKQDSLSFSPTGLSPSMVGLSRAIRLTILFCNFPDPSASDPDEIPQPRCCNARRLYTQTGLGCSPFARRYLGNRNCFLFLRVLRCFTSPRWLFSAYVFSRKCSGMTRNGLPHSEIPGSKVVCTSPRLIAAYHVLHRLLVPRHPPYALSSLTENPLHHGR